MSAIVKKSFNISADLAQKLDEFVTENPGLSLTLIMQQALEQWLKTPSLKVNIPRRHNDDDIDAVIRNNGELMDDLAK